MYVGTGEANGSFSSGAFFGDGIFKSTDGGQTWSNISYGLRINKDTSFPYYVKSIAVHPTNPDILFVATGSGLYQSIDGGANWKLK